MRHRGGGERNGREEIGGREESEYKVKSPPYPLGKAAASRPLPFLNFPQIFSISFWASHSRECGILFKKPTLCKGVNGSVFAAKKACGRSNRGESPSVSSLRSVSVSLQLQGFFLSPSSISSGFSFLFCPLWAVVLGPLLFPFSSALHMASTVLSQH